MPHRGVPTLAVMPEKTRARSNGARPVAPAPVDRPAGSTRERLQRAGERLFARDGIHRVRLREINELAGQRNPSALHYHFGSRQGLVDAILVDHQRAMDVELVPRLDDMESRATPPPIREIVETTVGPLAAELRTESGRDFLRIIPQILDMVNLNVRDAGSPPGVASNQPARTLALLDRRLAGLPRAVRRERLVAYVLLLTGLMAERAQRLEEATTTTLDHDQFVTHVVDVVTSVLEAPSTIEVGP